MKQVRYDRTTLRAPRKTTGGRMRYDGVFTRVGIFTYPDPAMPGGLRRELRPADEVFAPTALSALEDLPVVENHPSEREGLVRADSTRARGWTAEGVRRDGDLVIGSLLVTDPSLIDTIARGKNALSVGYEVDYDPTPGEHPTFGKYDGIQRNIRGDHMAIVDAGRAGPEAVLRVDGVSDTRVEIPAHAFSVPPSLTEANVPHTLSKDGDRMEEKLKELTEALATEKAARANADQSVKDLTARADAAQGEVVSLKAQVVSLTVRADAASEVPTLKAQLAALSGQVEEQKKLRADAEDPKRFDARVTRRCEVIRAAQSVLGDQLRGDEVFKLSDRDLQLSVITKVNGSVDKNRSDEYVAAAFDTAVQVWTKGEQHLATMRNVQTQKLEQRSDSRSAREKMIAYNRGEEAGK